jgi:hypothetical protein
VARDYRREIALIHGDIRFPRVRAVAYTSYVLSNGPMGSRLSGHCATRRHPRCGRREHESVPPCLMPFSWLFALVGAARGAMGFLGE